MGSKGHAYIFWNLTAPTSYEYLYYQSIIVKYGSVWRRTIGVGGNGLLA